MSADRDETVFGIIHRVAFDLIKGGSLDSYRCDDDNIKVKVMQCRHRPGVAQRVPGSYGSQIS